MPMYTCQLWYRYTQPGIRRIPVAYGNAYGMLHSGRQGFAYTKLPILS